MNIEILKIQQGFLGEKIATNIFNNKKRFGGWNIDRYGKQDLLVKTNRKKLNCQIKTIVPFVTKGYWSVSGEKAISNFLNAGESYIISIPTVSFKNCEFAKKYEGKMLKVNTEKLKKQGSLVIKDNSLIIPMAEEFVEEYEVLEDDVVKELLKYPVSDYAASYKSWKRVTQ